MTLAQKYKSKQISWSLNDWRPCQYKEDWKHRMQQELDDLEG